MTDAYQPIPDDKDWTWVIDQGCPECGFEPQDPPVTGARLTATIPRWQAVLARADVAIRPEPRVWSPLEYACHVRDVCRLFERRLELMLETDDPTFDNWDQDETAIAEDYAHQDAVAVATELTEAAESVSIAFDRVRDEEWGRPSRRSNGSRFSVSSFAVYFLHDVEHHLHDVAG